MKIDGGIFYSLTNVKSVKIIGGKRNNHYLCIEFRNIFKQLKNKLNYESESIILFQSRIT